MHLSRVHCVQPPVWPASFGFGPVHPRGAPMLGRGPKGRIEAASTRRCGWPSGRCLFHDPTLGVDECRCGPAGRSDGIEAFRNGPLVGPEQLAERVAARRVTERPGTCRPGRRRRRDGLRGVADRSPARARPPPPRHPNRRLPPRLLAGGGRGRSHRLAITLITGSSLRE